MADLERVARNVSRETPTRPSTALLPFRPRDVPGRLTLRELGYRGRAALARVSRAFDLTRPTPAGSPIPVRWDAPMYVPNRNDRNATWELSQVGPDLLRACYAAARGGNLQPIASLTDLMVQTDPHVKGASTQRKLGVVKMKFNVVDADDSPEGKKAGEAIRTAIKGCRRFGTLLTSIVESELRGVGIIDVVHRTDAKTGRREWKDFVYVPQARTRYDFNSEEVAMTSDAFDWQGAILSGAPPGRFVIVEPDKTILDPALRGAYRSIHGPWLDRLYGRKWRRDSVERWGLPIPVGRYRGEKQRQMFVRGFSEMGANGGLVIEDGAGFELHEPPVGRGGSKTPQEALMQDSADEISIGLVGQTQTLTVRADQGSKASASTQNLVRLDIALGDWMLIDLIVGEQVFVPYLEYNDGPDVAAKAPSLVPELDEPADLLELAQAIALLVDRGMPIPYGFVRKAGSIPTLSEQEKAAGDFFKPAAPKPDPFGQDAAAGADAGGKVLPTKGVREVFAIDPLTGRVRTERRAAVDPHRHLEALVDLFARRGGEAMRPIADLVTRTFDEVEAAGGSLGDVRRRLEAQRDKIPYADFASVVMATEIEALLRGYSETTAA